MYASVGSTQYLCLASEKQDRYNLYIHDQVEFDESVI